LTADNGRSQARGPQRAASRRGLLTPVFLRIMAVNFGYFLSFGVLNPVLPRFIRGPLHQSDVGVGIGLASFTVTALLLRQFSGRFGDRRGRHVGIRIGCVANTCGMLGLLFAHSLVHVVALRLLGGIAEAFIFVGVATAVQDISPDDRRGEAASLFSLSLFVALAIGPLIGEQVLDRFGYHGVWVLAACAAGLGVLFSWTIPDTRTHDTSDASSPPLVHRAAIRPGAILGCAIWGLAAFNGYMPLYALKIGMKGASPVFLANAVVIMLFRSIGARIPDQFGPLRTARFALFFTPVGLAVMGLWASVPGLFTGAIIMAVGQALAFPALMSVAVNNAPPTERGAVMGTFTAFFDLSFGGGALALGVVAHAFGYNGAFLVASAIATLGLAMVLFAPPRVRPPAETARVFEIEPPGE
jgi:MFS family permease